MRPGLVLALVLATAAPAAAQDLVEAGQHAFIKQGCHGCHVIGKTGTPLASNLTHVGARYRPEELVRWLRDPSAVRPSAHMAALELTDEDIRALAEFLGAQR